MLDVFSFKRRKKVGGGMQKKFRLPGSSHSTKFQGGFLF